MMVKDAEGHSTGKVFYMDWPGWYSRTRGGGSEGASILSISTDKQQYKVGEKSGYKFAIKWEWKGFG